MQLSTNFSLSEFTRTSTNLPNEPNAEQISALRLLVTKVLQPLRTWYGRAIRINSGFRSPEVNAAVSKSKTSDHMFGRAADITAGSLAENEKLFFWCKENLKYDQLIHYDFRWIHISYRAKGNRQQTLRESNGRFIQVRKKRNNETP